MRQPAESGQLQEPTGPLFVTDDEIGRRLRAVAGELRVIASRRRAVELAAELDALAQRVDPAGGTAA